MFKEMYDFVRYVIDPKKVRLIILMLCCLVLCVLVGCRTQQKKDMDTFEAEKAELVAKHETELAYALSAEALRSSEPANEHKNEYEAVAKVLYGYRNNSDNDLIAIVYCIWNRYEHANYPDDIVEVCRQEQQWMGYSDDNPVLSHLYDIAKAELDKLYSGSYRLVSPDYIFMYWSEDGVVLRDRFEEDAHTRYWRA